MWDFSSTYRRERFLPRGRREHRTSAGSVPLRRILNTEGEGGVTIVSRAHSRFNHVMPQENTVFIADALLSISLFLFLEKTRASTHASIREIVVVHTRVRNTAGHCSDASLPLRHIWSPHRRALALHAPTRERSRELLLQGKKLPRKLPDYREN